MSKPMKKIPAFIALIALVISACTTPAVETPLAPTMSPSATALQQATLDPATPAAPDYPPAVSLALQRAAQLSGTGIEMNQILTFEKMDWPDACLGLAGKDEMCAEVITPGYRGVIQSGETQMEFRTDESGELIRFIPGAALAARQALAGQVQVEPTTIQFIQIEAVEWPDSCLGVQKKDILCLQVITPGYRVVMRLDQTIYEYHTDQIGRKVIQAGVSQLEQPSQLTWILQTETQCQSAIITSDWVDLSTCGSETQRATIANPRIVEDLAGFAALFASFSAETAAGKIELNGQGSVTATPAQQRMLAEWARMIVQETQSGSRDPLFGRVIQYHQEGGIAGFCKDVTIYLNGEAFAQTCSGTPPTEFPRTWLTAQQLQSLYRWVDRIRSFEVEVTDLATADAMTTRLIFTGARQNSAAPEEQQWMVELAELVHSQLTLPLNSTNLEIARQQLLIYFSALNEGRYSDAAIAFSGDIQVLRDLNPELPPDDTARLFEAACTVNGFRCDLQIKNIVSSSQLSPITFRFSIELQNPDGSLFVMQPCCGASEADFPSNSQFDFIVEVVEGFFTIRDLPVYVP